MRNTDPRPPLNMLSSDEVLEQLCLALRDVGVHDGRAPLSERGIAAIERVKGADSELRNRGLDPAADVVQLSQETGWLMQALLDDCRAYPGRRPRLREKDGVRRAFRCVGCRQRERPESDEDFFLCDDCLKMVAEHLAARTAPPNVFIFRTYTAEARCPHADEDTVLAVYPWYGEHDDIGRGFCEKCIAQELESRRSAV
jgi:hypothetical protein